MLRSQGRHCEITVVLRHLIVCMYLLCVTPVLLVKRQRMYSTLSMHVSDAAIRMQGAYELY